MNTIRPLSDKLAISISTLCTIHCLMLPLIVSWLPTATALTLEDEIFHLSMVLAVIPLSLYALTLGCKQHKRYRVIVLGTIGLLLLILAVFLGHDILGEFGEKWLTVTGASFITIAHVFNHYFCRHDNDCGCDE